MSKDIQVVLATLTTFAVDSPQMTEAPARACDSSAGASRHSGLRGKAEA